MPDPATALSTPVGPVEAAIRQRLAADLTPTSLVVVNESASHAGHRGDDGSGESHFRVEIEAPSFAKLSRVARQRLVNRSLADLLDGHIHALAIRARAPGEAA
ncbi:BolA family protein [uncultured Sphingomonas sp.]|uniref:BolA family protein n=1 Tax=uncultured Sphingomonas sp. TaxID=158754 RepID=UPI0035CB5297